MADATQQRVNMVDSQVRPSDVTDRRIIRAMLEVPREAYVPASLRSLAYADGDIGLDGGRVLLAPRVLAKLLQLAHLGDGDQVLVAGCATGYAAAVMARMGAKVTGVEPDDGLRAIAMRELGGAASDIGIFAGTPAAGYAEAAPYDVILVDGGVEVIPETLLDQLKDGGRLVAVRVERRGGRATVWRRSGRVFGETSGFDAVAPILPGFEKIQAFAL